MSKKTKTMVGKICLITGANAGIGRAITLGLAKMEATVVIVCRDRVRGETALAEIKEESGNDSILLIVADLASQASISQLVDDFIGQFDKLDVLINNAGVIPQQSTHTVDGLETQFAVNYLAGFYLTNLLLDSLNRSSSARIINVTSNAHESVSINFDDLQSEKFYNPRQVYRQTKLANILFTYELSRRLEGTQVTVNCVHPGVVATRLLRNYSGAKGDFNFMSKLLYSTPEKGAQGPLFLASSIKVEGVNGKYFVNNKETKSSLDSYDLEIAGQLWEVSEKLTHSKTSQ